MTTREEACAVVDLLALTIDAQLGDPDFNPRAMGFGIDVGLRLAVFMPEYAQTLAAALGTFGPAQQKLIRSWAEACPVESNAQG